MFLISSHTKKTLCPLSIKDKGKIPWMVRRAYTNCSPSQRKSKKSLLCRGTPHPNAFMIVEIDASNIGYNGVLKQKEFASALTKQVVRYHSSI